MNGLQDRAIQRKIKRDRGIERKRDIVYYHFLLWGFEGFRLTGLNL